MLFLDTSALVKRYLAEDGREGVLALMASDDLWAASGLARTESDLALCRTLRTSPDLAGTRARLALDWAEFTVVPPDAASLNRAAEIGCATGLRTLDAIHLAAAETLPGVTLVTFDRRMAAAAVQLGIPVAPEGVA
jgi:predicted nucleic acid-binding protein